MNSITKWANQSKPIQVDGTELMIPQLKVSLVSKLMKFSEEKDSGIRASLMQELVELCLKEVFSEATEDEIKNFPMAIGINIMNAMIEHSGLNELSVKQP